MVYLEAKLPPHDRSSCCEMKFGVIHNKKEKCIKDVGGEYHPSKPTSKWLLI